MSSTMRFASIARVATIAAALAIPAATAAYADDVYNSGGLEAVVQQSAASVNKNTQSAAQDASRLASTAKAVGGKRDLLGTGGQQDAVAREIYRPGAGSTGAGG